MRLCLVFSAVFFNAFWLNAAEAQFKVLPWNGYKAAVSLTFDDGDPIHLSLVIPEMQKRGQKGTFFLITDKIQDLDGWKKAAAFGVEIGNHSANHKHASELTAEDEKYEVDNAGKFLQKEFKQPVMSFAYPFVEITEGLRKRVEKNCMIARGGFGSYYYTPVMNPDWYNISSQGTTTAHGFDVYKSWIDQSLDAGAWTVFMIHAVEGSDWWQPVPKETFLKLLDYLKDKNKEVWTAPFGEIGAYWKAQKAVENAKISAKNSGNVITWEKPVPFPAGITLKIKTNDLINIISQAGKLLQPDSEGVYSVDFDKGEMTVGNGGK